MKIEDDGVDVNCKRRVKAAAAAAELQHNLKKILKNSHISYILLYIMKVGNGNE